MCMEKGFLSPQHVAFCLTVGTVVTDFLVWLTGLAPVPPASSGGTLDNVSARAGVNQILILVTSATGHLLKGGG